MNIDWTDLRNNATLDDMYNILCRNKPHRNSKLYKEWNYLESIAYEELLNENDRPKECYVIINQIIDFLDKQKKLTIKYIIENDKLKYI